MANVARAGGGVFEIDLDDRRDSDDEIIDYEQVRSLPHIRMED